MKRAYKLQEFVAHASNVNCLKIGKKTSRVLVTGGEDAKVNMWAIGRPNPIMSLSGHSSAVESVTFDAAEALVAAGAASGTIKLWDLEEAKVVRTLTGHRSNCIAVDFHPFGEFFASGSLDTNLKIWDIRRKGCIHTYKGHTRGVNVLKFSPDGRWVVSGGEDNIVKLWDLTAGKLMHDFKCHEGQINCLDFHPHEFLLGTGSADRTVKFWDLETFELIGSAGPEVSGVRSMIFNPDGQTLMVGLQEHMKVFSWEPLRCHDVVDVGWSKLADLNIHEGKLLGCSFNQSCVGIWVVDLACVGPYAVGSNGHGNGIAMINQPSQQMVDGSLKSSSVVRNNLTHVEASMKDMKLTSSALSLENLPNTPHRAVNSIPNKMPVSGSSAPSSYGLPSRRAGAGKPQPNPTVQSTGKIDVVPVVVPRHTSDIRPISHVMSSEIVSSTKNENIKTSSNTPRLSTPRIDMNSDISGFDHKSPTNRGMLVPSAVLSSADSENEDENVNWIGTGKFRRTVSIGAERDTITQGHARYGDTHSGRGEDPYGASRDTSFTSNL
uniref:Katanin p80 WD40 repeat-containing subunit B1 homolog n=1 Tax=Marsilea vestita TaxID=59764 RepID=I6XG52_MARVE|nr:katanin-like protein [Marsilea vestita]